VADVGSRRMVRKPILCSGTIGNKKNIAIFNAVKNPIFFNPDIENF